MKNFIEYIFSDKMYIGLFAIIVILIIVLFILVISLKRTKNNLGEISKLQNRKSLYKENVQSRLKQNQYTNRNFNEEELKTESLAYYNNNSNNTNRDFNNKESGFNIDQIPVLSYEDKTEIINNMKSNNKDFQTEMLCEEEFEADLGETEILSKPKPKSLAILSYEENGQIKELSLFNNITNIGRDTKACDAVISSDSHMGRKHALIYYKDEKFYLADLNSKNGTFINGNRIQGERQVYDGDVIKLATTEFRFKVC